MTSTSTIDLQNVTTSFFQPINLIDVITISDIPEDVNIENSFIAKMQAFQTKPLEAVIKDLQQAKYKPETIKEIIAGLKTLPEYRD